MIIETHFINPDKNHSKL